MIRYASAPPGQRCQRGHAAAATDYFIDAMPLITPRAAEALPLPPRAAVADDSEGASFSPAALLRGSYYAALLSSLSASI